jgi:glutamine synthetase
VRKLKTGEVWNMARRTSAITKALTWVKKSGVKEVSLKFVDLPGRWHQVVLPVSNFTQETFSRGVAFDGSSVPGFTRLESGDLGLVPDAASHFLEEPAGGGAASASFICYVVEADTKKPFARDPRLVASKAENYLLRTGIADQAMFMPELEFNLLDEVKMLGLPAVTGYTVKSLSAGIEPDWAGKTYPWISGKGYHAVPPLDRHIGLRSLMVETIGRAGIEVKYAHHEGGSAGQCEIEVRPAGLLATADNIITAKYFIKNIAAAHNMVATFIPKPIFGQPGNGMHFHQHLVKRGRNIFFKKGGYGDLSREALYYIGGLLKHGRALLALTCPSTNSYKRLVPGFEAPVCFTYSIANRSAAVRIPKGIGVERDARVEFRPSDGSSNAYLATAAMLMAGLDGIRHKIDPEREGFGPFDLNAFKVADLEAKGIMSVPFDLHEALEALRADHDFLLAGDVFTEDLISTWIDMKYRLEIYPVGQHPHPYEIELYLDC